MEFYLDDSPEKTLLKDIFTEGQESLQRCPGT